MIRATCVRKMVSNYIRRAVLQFYLSLDKYDDAESKIFTCSNNQNKELQTDCKVRNRQSYRGILTIFHTHVENFKHQSSWM